MTAVWVSDDELRRQLASKPVPPARSQKRVSKTNKLRRLFTGDRVWDLALLVIAQAHADARLGDHGARAWIAYVQGRTNQSPPLPDVDNDE